MSFEFKLWCHLNLVVVTSSELRCDVIWISFVTSLKPYFFPFARSSSWSSSVLNASQLQRRKNKIRKVTATTMAVKEDLKKTLLVSLQVRKRPRKFRNIQGKPCKMWKSPGKSGQVTGRSEKVWESLAKWRKVQKIQQNEEKSRKSSKMKKSPWKDR